MPSEPICSQALRTTSSSDGHVAVSLATGPIQIGHNIVLVGNCERSLVYKGLGNALAFQGKTQKLQRFDGTWVAITSQIAPL